MAEIDSGTQFLTEIEMSDGTTVSVPFLRQSERSSFKNCQHQWNWVWNEGLTPALPKQDARWFGTGIHLALAEWYVKGTKRGKPLLDTWENFVGENYNTISIGPYFDKAEFVEAKALGVEMLSEYEKFYHGDPEWDVISTEQRYRMKIKNEHGGVATVLVGTFDAVIRDRNRKVWMLDHKTARNRITMNHLIKDEQAGTYVSVGTLVLRQQGLIGPDEVVHGIIYNFLRKGMRPRHTGKGPRAGTLKEQNEKGEFLNLDGSVSSTQPSPFFARDWVIRNTFERKRQLERIREESEHMALLRNGGLPLLKTPGEHCGWCDFKDLCDVDEQGGDVEQFKKAAFRIRDPYADHRAGAKNSKVSVLADKRAKAKTVKKRAF